MKIDDDRSTITLNALATYVAGSSADVRIVGADMSIVNTAVSHEVVVFPPAVLLVDYVNVGLFQDSGLGSVLLQFAKCHAINRAVAKIWPF